MVVSKFINVEQLEVIISRGVGTGEQAYKGSKDQGKRRRM